MKYAFIMLLLLFVVSGCTSNKKNEKPSKGIESYSFHHITAKESEVLTMEDIEFDEDDQISYDEDYKELVFLHSDGSMTAIHYSGRNAIVFRGNGGVDFIHSDENGNGTVLRDDGGIDFFYSDGNGGGTVIRDDGNIDFIYSNGGGDATVLRGDGGIDFVYSDENGNGTVLRDDGGIDFFYSDGNGGGTVIRDDGSIDILY